MYKTNGELCTNDMVQLPTCEGVKVDFSHFLKYSLSIVREFFWRSLRSREFEVSVSDSVGGSILRSLHKKPRWCKVVRRVESMCFV